MVNEISVKDFFEKKETEFILEIISGEGGLNRKITVPDVNRMGLVLSGFFEYFPHQCIQILGLGETTYLKSHAVKDEIFEKIFSFDMPAICVTRSLDVPVKILTLAQKHNVPVIRTALETGWFTTAVTLFIEDAIAPSCVKHGVLVNVSGMGVLLFGDSSIGKSECALELIKRGHVLVADDVVKIKYSQGETLVGSGEELIKHHMEIRGVGIIDIRNLFGIFAVMDSTKIDLVVQLEHWKGEKEYERLGLDESSTEILGVKIPVVTIPVKPGRNLSSLIEIAAMNQRLKMRGYNAAQDLNKRLMDMMKQRNTELTRVTEHGTDTGN